MRKIIIAFASTILFISCKNNGGSFTVEGSLQNIQGSVIKIYEVPVGAEQPILKDSVRMNADGSFTWKTKKPKEETLYYITSDKQGNIASVITDADKVKIEADFSNRQQPLIVTGSKASEQSAAYMKEVFSYLGKLYEWDQKNDSLLGDAKTDAAVKSKLLQERGLQTAAMKKYVTDFIRSAKSPMLKIYAISNYQSLAVDPQFAGFALDDLDSKEAYEFATAAVKEFPEHKGIAAYKKKVEEMLNRKAPDFTLPDVNDKPVALSSFRGKYVLVDFWASWCGPCRAENPNVVKAYNKFKDKNFTILGVSLDRPGQKNQWLKAINDDKLTWTHVSDLRFWESAVVPLYGISGIPYNVLVAPDGTIVAENLRGAMLEEKLVEVLSKPQ